MKSKLNISKRFKKKSIDVSFLDKSVLSWLSKLNENEIIFPEEQDNKCKYYFKNHPNVKFYNSKQDYFDKSTLDELMNTLLPLELVFENENHKYQVNSGLINFYKENSNLTEKQVLKEFIVKNFKNCVEEYFINALNNDVTKVRDKKFGNFWWSVIDFIDLQYKKGKLNEIFQSEQNKQRKSTKTKKFVETYFCDDNGNLIELISDNFDSMFEKIIKNSKNLITSAPSQEKSILWAENIIIDEDTFASTKQESVGNENPINKALENIDNMSNKEKNLLLIKTNIFDFFTSKHTTNYKLPIFQRTYSWNPNIIEGFFNSLFNDYKDQQGFSLLNSIILTSRDNTTQIIDGQQRITSLIIIIFALAKYYKHLENSNDPKNDLINLLSAPIKNMLDLVKNFANNDENYEVLQSLINNQYTKENKTIKSSSFYKNWEKVCLLIQERIKKDIDKLYGFIEYIMKKTFFSLSYIRDLKEKDVAKIFCNLNKYSKKLGSLDIFRNTLYEFFEGNKKDLIYAYDNTINLYFRQKNKPTNDEDESLIQDFLDSVLVKYGKFVDILRINNYYKDKITNSYEKFDLLLEQYRKDIIDNQTQKVLEYLWIDILMFEYFSSGSINEPSKLISSINEPSKLISSINEPSENDKKENMFLMKIREKSDEFRKKIKYFYLNFQIYHLSKGAKKTVFIPLIWMIADKLKLFVYKDKNNKEIQKTYRDFSLYLSQIEKFSLLWDTEHKSQSLTAPINKICRDKLIKDDKLIDPNDLYDNLEKIIPNLKNKSKPKKIWDLYELLDKKFNLEIKDNNAKNATNNNDYKNVLGRLAYSVRQTKSPQYFHEYESEDQNNSDLDFTNYTYDHNTVPQTLDQDLKKIFNAGHIEDYQIQNIIHKIGNGSLRTRPDNSRKGNKHNSSENKENWSITVKGWKTKFNIINFEDLQNEQLVLKNDEFIQIPETIDHFNDFVAKNSKAYQNSNTDQIKKYFEEFTEKIEERSRTIIKSYISALFYDWFKNN